MHLYLFLATLPFVGIVPVASTAEYFPGKVFDRFVTIWLENEDFTPITENEDYQNLSLQGILLTNYYALTHPSQPNYIASVGGDYFGLDNDNEVHIPENVSSVVDLFDSRGIAWKGYMESIPSSGYTGAATTNASGHNAYAKKHNPLVSFASVSNNQSRAQNIVSFDQFESDLESKSLAQWMHMSPDMSDDGHDTGLAYGVSWARRFLAPLLTDEYFINRTLVLLTLDESATYSDSNKVASLLLGDIPSNLKRSSDDTFYTHYSILATLTFQTWAATINQMVDTADLHLNESYPGYLNSRNRISFPTPNVELVGAGGQGVLGPIAAAWVNGTDCGSFLTPYNGSGVVFDGITPPQYGTVAVAANASGTATATACAAGGQSTRKSDGNRLERRVFWLPIILAISSMLMILPAF